MPRINMISGAIKVQCPDSIIYSLVSHPDEVGKGVVLLFNFTQARRVQKGWWTITTELPDNDGLKECGDKLVYALLKHNHKVCKGTWFNGVKFLDRWLMLKDTVK